MSTMPTEQEIERYQHDGVLLVRGVFAEWEERLRAGVAKAMAAPSPLERTVRPADGGAIFFQDYCTWSRIAEFNAFVFESPAAELAARLMRSRTARFFHEHILVKEPGTSVATPWHHDLPYYCVDGMQTVSLWIALDKVARETAVEYVVGSHRWGRQFSPTRFDGSKLYPGDRFEPIPDIAAERDRHAIVGWAMQPGDAVAFNYLTLHGAPGNQSRTRRRAFSARWVGDDVVFADRGARTSPPFPDVRLRAGDALDAPEFPLVYRAQL
jgi:ectoine hydroxylase-related dioxygenase (phytanoyl-CoA dioxygenase family)